MIWITLYFVMSSLKLNAFETILSFEKWEWTIVRYSIKQKNHANIFHCSIEDVNIEYANSTSAWSKILLLLFFQINTWYAKETLSRELIQKWKSSWDLQMLFKCISIFCLFFIWNVRTITVLFYLLKKNLAQITIYSILSHI